MHNVIQKYVSEMCMKVRSTINCTGTLDCMRDTDPQEGAECWEERGTA